MKQLNGRGARIVCVLTALALVTLSAAGCGQTEQVAAEVDTGIRVSAQLPETGTLHIESGYIGAIEPGDQVTVFPKLGGTVTQVHAAIGDTVQAGQLLFELDPADVLDGIATAQAAYDTVFAQVNQALGSTMDGQIIKAESDLKASQYNLSEARRALRDFNDGQPDRVLKAELEMDNAKAKFDAALAAFNLLLPTDPNYDEEKRKVDQLEAVYMLSRTTYNDLDDEDDATTRKLRATYKNAQVVYDASLAAYNLTLDAAKIDTTEVVQAQLKQAEVSYQNALSNLDKTKIYAPISGVIEARNVDPQSLVSQQSATFTISNKESMQVVFNISADAVDGISVGDNVVVENGSAVHEATVVEVGSMADPQSGLFKVKAKFAQTAPDLLTGISVKVTASTAQANDALLLPLNAVYYEKGQPYVYIYRDGVAVRTEFESGLSDSVYLEVRSGVSKNDVVITSWNPSLIDGAAVRLDEQSMQLAAQTDAPQEDTPQDEPSDENTGDGETPADENTQEEQNI